MPKQEFKLVYKKQLIPKVHFFTFKTDAKTTFVPGQFFSLEVAPKVYRSYSTVQCSNKAPNFFQEGLPELESGEYASFMISTKPGGEASVFFQEIQLGGTLQAVGPSGQFKLIENNKPKVFIATGTGLAPFIAMIDQELLIKPDSKISIFFGCWKRSDNFAQEFLSKFQDKAAHPNFNLYIVPEDLEGGEENDFLKAGRVTTVVPNICKDYINTDFYICGHPLMVADMGVTLENLGAIEKQNLFMEKFGIVKKSP